MKHITPFLIFGILLLGTLMVSSESGIVSSTVSISPVVSNLQDGESRRFAITLANSGDEVFPKGTKFDFTLYYCADKTKTLFPEITCKRVKHLYTKNVGGLKVGQSKTFYLQNYKFKNSGTYIFTGKLQRLEQRYVSFEHNSKSVRSLATFIHDYAMNGNVKFKEKFEVN